MRSQSPFSHLEIRACTAQDIVIDFSAKGGPKNVLAKTAAGGKLKFPDGNVWTKV